LEQQNDRRRLAVNMTDGSPLHGSIVSKWLNAESCSHRRTI